MSKVICDVCGTSYPDTATQCPICGYVRTSSTQSDAEQTKTEDSYTYVKGGRFSKANVKKRNNNGGVTTVNVVRDKKKETVKTENEGSGNKGLVITVLVLLILIIAVVLYITFRHIVFNDISKNKSSTETTTTTVVNDDQTDDADQEKTFKFEKNEITLTKVDETQELYITPLPAAEDELTVSSSNNKVAKAVIRNGVVRVTGVGPGEATIFLKSGSFTAECKVLCDIEIEISLKGNIELSQIDATEDVLVNRNEFTEEELEKMEWISSDSTVVTVENGIVTAEKEGSAEITVKYRTQELKIKVQCTIKEEGTSTGDSELDYSVSVGTGGVSES